LSDETQVNGSVPCVFGMLAGYTGTNGIVGRFGMLMLWIAVVKRVKKMV